MKSVLFVCTGNTCRSPLAAGIAERIAEQFNLPFRFTSAGLSGSMGQPPPDEAVRVAREFGCDLEGWRSRPIDRDLVEQADLILAMTRSQRDQLRRRFHQGRSKIFVLDEYAADGTRPSSDIEDPIGSGLEQYRHRARQIHSAVVALIARLRQQADQDGRASACGGPAPTTIP